MNEQEKPIWPDVIGSGGSSKSERVVAVQPQTSEAAKRKAIYAIKDLFTMSVPASVFISDNAKDLIDEQLPEILTTLVDEAARPKP